VSQKRLDEFNARLDKKLALQANRVGAEKLAPQSPASGKRSTDKQRRNGSPDDLDVRLRRKMEGRKASSANSSDQLSGTDTFEAVIRRKMDGGGRSPSRALHGSASTSSEKGSLSGRAVSSSLGSSASSIQKLDDFSARLQRKLDDRNNKGQDLDRWPDRSRSQVKKSLERQRSSSLDLGSSAKRRQRHDERWQREVEARTNRNRRSRNPPEEKRLTRQRSSSVGANKSESLRKLDEFDAKLRRKQEKKKARGATDDALEAKINERDMADI